MPETRPFPDAPNTAPNTETGPAPLVLAAGIAGFFLAGKVLSNITD